MVLLTVMYSNIRTIDCGRPENIIIYELQALIRVCRNVEEKTYTVVIKTEIKIFLKPSYIYFPSATSSVRC